MLKSHKNNTKLPQKNKQNNAQNIIPLLEKAENIKNRTTHCSGVYGNKDVNKFIEIIYIWNFVTSERWKGYDEGKTHRGFHCICNISFLNFQVSTWVCYIVLYTFLCLNFFLTFLQITT